jgi:solute carrier family 13 (sodium-dependent dicarboxylate transporter), member 2/3/5
MLLGVPLSLLMLWICYQLMVNVFFKIRIKSLPEVAELLDKQAAQLGRIKSAEKRSLLIFSLAAFFWIFGQPLNTLIAYAGYDFKIEEYAVAMAFGSLLFLIPKAKDSREKLLRVGDLKHISWGILVLFGGGMCMAKGLETTGVIKFAGEWIQQSQQGNFPALLFLVILSALFLTELMSNVALAQIYIPVVFGISQSMGIDNPHIMGITVTIACSFAFMFPISTPPNAVVFSSGKVKMKDMAFAGFFLNIVGVILLWLAGLYIIPYLF